MTNEHLSYLVAFTAGVLTFLSPCFLPLLPSYIVYLTGISLEELTRGSHPATVRTRAVVHTLFFIAGFTLVFILLGLTATFFGKILFKYQKAIRIGGGVLIILFGLQLMGVLKLDFLAKEKRFHFTRKGIGYLSSFLIGVTFAAAWTPCAGVILGSILVLASTKESLATGATFLAVYSLGIAVPLLLSSLLINSFLLFFKKAQRVLGAVAFISGIFLVIVGIAVITNYLQVFSTMIQVHLSKLFGPGA